MLVLKNCQIKERTKSSWNKSCIENLKSRKNKMMSQVKVCMLAERLMNVVDYVDLSEKNENKYFKAR